MLDNSDHKTREYHHSFVNGNDDRTRNHKIISFTLYPGVYQPSGWPDLNRAKPFYDKFLTYKCSFCSKTNHNSDNIDQNGFYIVPDCDCIKIITDIIIKSIGRLVHGIILEYCGR